MCRARQGPFPQRFGPATGRYAEVSAQETDHRVGNIESTWIGGEFLDGDSGADKVQREVTDDLRRRRHLDQPAEQPICTGVGLLDVLESVPQAQCDGLLPQIRQLSAGNLVGVDAAGRCGEPGFERRVDLSQRLPVRFEVAHIRQIQSGVTLGVGRGGNDCRQRRLARGACHRRRCSVDGVGAGLPRRHIARQLTTGGVVGVHVHRQIEVATQGGDQRRRRWDPQQPGHILDRQDVRAGIDGLFREFQVVVEGVEGFVRVRQVPRVGQRDFSNRPCGITHRIDRGAHRVNVVERVEDPEDIDPVFAASATNARATESG